VCAGLDMCSAEVRTRTHGLASIEVDTTRGIEEMRTWMPENEVDVDLGVIDSTWSQADSALKLRRTITLTALSH